MSSETLGGDTTCPTAEGTAEMPELHSHDTPPQSRPTAEVAASLGTDLTRGLARSDAEERFARFGPNRLREERVTPGWIIFVRQFQDFTIYVLFGALAIAALQGQVVEAVAILAVLLLNGVLGFVQESRAASALSALKQLSAPVATVVRDGAETDIPAQHLVLGDLVVLEAGDAVPADGRLVEDSALRVVEAALTGESETSLKDATSIAESDTPLGEQTGMVFAGTTVAVGRGRFIVTATGPATQMGHVAELLAETPEELTPLQVELDRVGKRIALIVLAVAAVVFVEETFVALRLLHESGLLAAFGDPAFRASLTAGLLVAVSLAVAAIPEGLPAIVTVSLSLGVRRMAERNALVRRLHAVETLGSTTFICADKTGTLTRNAMAVQRLVVGIDEARIEGDRVEPLHEKPRADDLALLLAMAAANNDARAGADGELLGDPTETALFAATHLLAPGLTLQPRIADVPFDSHRKRMTTVHETADGGTVAFTKGGADVVLALCSRALVRGEAVELDDALRGRIRQANATLAADGFRTLAFALRHLPAGALGAHVRTHGSPLDPAEIERDLTYVGILGLVDPPRPEVPAAIAECHRAGIRVAMITGDHALTARAIASEVGLIDSGNPHTPGADASSAARVIDGAELEAMSAEQLDAAVEDTRVYARVNPEHKLRIVDALKRHGEIVAMTGDGVNDAPALKRADIGVAMGLVGTDVARDASDLVLADDDFATIVHAVELGRVVFDDLRKVILFLLSCNMSEVLVVFLTALISPTTALLPLQLLWINLITDGLPALALGVDPAERGVMDRPPRDAGESILSASRQRQIGWQGLVMTVACLGLYYGIAPAIPGTSAAVARTMLFTTLVLSQLLHAFDFRSAETTVWHRESLRNRWLILALVGSMLLHVGIIYTPPLSGIFHTAPLSPAQWLAVVATALSAVVVMDITKVLVARARTRSSGGGTA